MAPAALLLEEPLIRTPYELMRRTHRAAQRQVEKDFTGVQSVLSNLLKSFDDRPLNEEAKSSVVAKLDQAGERVRGLKRKLDDLQPSENVPSALRRRLAYLDGMAESGATRDVEVKIEPVETEGEVKVEVKLSSDEAESKAASGEKMDVDSSLPLQSEVKEERVDAPERATSPVAPELVKEDTTLDRYIVDYLLRTGRQKAARALAEKQGIEPLVDLKLFAELIKIETALVEKQSVTEALAWCGENRGTLKKTQNNLEFMLRLQEFIELCRRRDTVGAIAYARKNLANWAVSHMFELQQAMTLLAFGEKTGVGVYRKLYDPSRWKLVRDQLRETFLGLYSLPNQPLLSLALSAGLSSLRLPSCARHIDPKDEPKSPSIPLIPAAPPLHNFEEALAFAPISADTTGDDGGTTPTSRVLQKHPNAPVGNVDCPTCDINLKVLAAELAYSHHVLTTLVCRISGVVMDSQNPPLAFPNGYVYSTKALAEMASSNFDVVTCPRTKESCAFSRLNKVYIS